MMVAAPAVVRAARTLPCVECGQPFYECDYKNGARRCKPCQRRRGPGNQRRHAAKNQGALFIDGLLRQQGRSRKEFSLTLGLHPNSFGGRCQQDNWHPPEAMVQRMAAELGVTDQELLRYMDGTLEEYRREVSPLVHRVYRLAENADRAAGHGDVYKAEAQQVVLSGGKTELVAFEARLNDLPRRMNLATTNAAAAQARGKSRPASVGRKIAAAKRPYFAALSAEEKKQLASHLHTPEVFIRAFARHMIALGLGPAVRANLGKHVGRYVDRYAKDGLTPQVARYMILEGLGDTLPPRAGKPLRGSKADIIRQMIAGGMTKPQIADEGLRREEAGEKGWSYDYVYNVAYRAGIAS